jgi:hypothetical protein
MTILPEMASYRCYTHWLSRPMTREETAMLTKGEMKARRLAQTRACRYRQKLADLLADHLADVARHDASLAPGRDIIDLYASHIIDA